MVRNMLRHHLLKKFDFVYFTFTRSMFRKMLYSILFFVFEFCIISYGYVLLHNYLSPADEHLSYSTSMYFTVISAATVGYGDHYPMYTITQWYVIFLIIMYLPFRFFYTAASIGFLFKNYSTLKQLGRWFPMLFDHIIVYCNAKSISRNNFLWLQRFIHENSLALKYRNTEILVVNSNQDANSMVIEFFAERGAAFRHVHFVNANLNEEDFFEKIRIDSAEQVYVLADEDDLSSDSDVFDMVYRINKETNYNHGITAELVNDSNRERIRKLGANVILRPNRSMPELLITSTIAPGSGQMVEEISSRGKDSIERFNLTCNGFKWADLLYHLNLQGIGTATAIIYNDESIDANPKGDTIIMNGKAILMLIHAMNTKDYAVVQTQIDAVMHKFVCKPE